MRFAWASLIVAVGLEVCGCGASAGDQVRAKVDQFVSAAAKRDYQTICAQVLAPSLLGHLAAGGVSCKQAMQVGLGNVQRPTLSIGKVTVSGQSATAIVLSGARGQEAALQAIKLVRTRAGWRIASLASAVP